jgi:hypothetical protein
MTSVETSHSALVQARQSSYLANKTGNVPFASTAFHGQRVGKLYMTMYLLQI